MATSICVSRCQILFKNEINRIGLRALFYTLQGFKESRHNSIHTCASSHPTLVPNDRNNLTPVISAAKKSSENEAVEVTYAAGLPQITVPLPSRRERCRFTLRPVTNTVGDFISMLRSEDQGVDRVVCVTCSGIRIASSDSIEALLERPFLLVINDRKFEVDPPPRERLTTEESSNLAEVRDVVQRLYEALEVREQRTRLERDIIGRMELVRTELEPLEQQKVTLDMQSDSSTRYLVWLGLGLMGVQFGVLARLTWWEYSWDIMEPVTYFVTYGTTMMCYAYYVLTKQEPNMPDVRDRQYLITFHKKAKRHKFDVDKYNKMKEEMYSLEKELFKLRDPLMFHAPRKPDPLHLQDNMRGQVPDNESVAKGDTKGNKC